jgi:predicted Zn finger-like uncharacterized protein
MIIECERCASKFNLDENLLKKEGSKVRCSFCQNVFTAFPPEPEPPEEEPDILEEAGEDLEERVALDAPGAIAVGRDETVEPNLQVDETGDLEEETVSETLEPVPEEESQIAERSIEEEEGLWNDQASGEQEMVYLSPDEIPDREGMGPEEPTGGMEGKEALEGRETGEERASQEAVVEAPRGERRGRSKLWLVALVILLLLAGGAVAVIVWVPSMIPEPLSGLKPQEKADTRDLGVKRLAFKGVKGSFIQTRSGAQRFVVQGDIRNEYPGKRSFILIKGTILDDTGEILNSMMVYAGNYFSEGQLKELSLEEISKELKNRYGKGRINYEIESGQSVPFMIVFENLPDNMSEYTVEAVRSSPAK